MKKITQIIILFLFTIIFIRCSDDDDDSNLINQSILTVTDADGNDYNTITIGDQIWMLENLKTTKFNDGTPITEYAFETHGNNWVGLNAPEALYQWADTDDLNNVHDEDLPFDYYGAMYNHFAIESGKLAPEGWRIPTEQDFIELENYLSNNGFSGNEALALKSVTGWIPSTGNGTNAIDFRGLPNGHVHAFGLAEASEVICTWATSDFNSTNNTRKMIQLFEQNSILFADNIIQLGAGIRCIKE